MNKKFFAALASATMAFTASGSIAVFADDFVEEKAPVLGGNDVKPTEKTVKWDKEHFGDLAKEDNRLNDKVVFDVAPTVKDGYVKTEDLKKVTSITFNATFTGEVKGLEYFTELKTFDDANSTISNKTLDFSANTKLASLTVKNAKDLTGIVLPEPTVDEDEVKHYSLTELELWNTKLTSLDLSEQKELKKVVVAYNYNLKKATVAKGTKSTPYAYDVLNISQNSLEEIDLANVQVNTVFALNDNRLGALDLSKTTLPKTCTTIALNDQKLYVSEDLATINVKDTFENVDTRDFAGTGYSDRTGVLDLEKNNETGYTYTAYDKDDNKRPFTVDIEMANPMNRVYNPNSGEHFYTADIKEKEALVSLGWQDEGFGWVAPENPVTDTDTNAVFRLYNPNAGDHHYTTKAEERDVLVAYGWKDEGKGWYSATTADKVDVYRQYNPYANGAGSHNYTTDKAENDYLVSLGWIYEGTGWYGLR